MLLDADIAREWSSDEATECVFLSTGAVARNDQSPDLQSEFTWHVCHCAADFSVTPSSQLNHFLPVFHRAMLGEENFNLAVKIYERDLAERKSAAQNTIMEFTMENDSPEQGNSDTILDTLLADSARLEREEAVFKTMIENDLFPEQVGADGNCALYTAAMLEITFPACLDDNLSSEQHERT